MRLNNRISRFALTAAFAALAGVWGCQSTHEKGVKSNMRTQWTDVAADTRTTTAAAEAVLKDQDLKNVHAKSTNVDGRVTANKADGTKVDVSIQKKSDNMSEVSVTVGSLGDPRLGAEIAKKVKTQAGSHSTDSVTP
jgi:hypothetical protein